MFACGYICPRDFVAVFSVQCIPILNSVLRSVEYCFYFNNTQNPFARFNMRPLLQFSSTSNCSTQILYGDIFRQIFQFDYTYMPRVLFFCCHYILAIVEDLNSFVWCVLFCTILMWLGALGDIQYFCCCCCYWPSFHAVLSKSIMSHTHKLTPKFIRLDGSGLHAWPSKSRNN